jgi:hypothetical protein
MVERSEKMFEVRKTGYFTEIVTNNPYADRIKERINKRKSSKDLMCHECKGLISVGSYYIRDKFWYSSYNSYLHQEVVKTKVNFICLECWKGDVPSLTSTNWR